MAMGSLASHLLRVESNEIEKEDVRAFGLRLSSQMLGPNRKDTNSHLTVSVGSCTIPSTWHLGIHISVVRPFGISILHHFFSNFVTSQEQYSCLFFWIDFGISLQTAFPRLRI